MNSGPQPDTPPRHATVARHIWILGTIAAFATLIAAVLLLPFPTSLLPGDLPVHQLLLEHRNRTVVAVLKAVTATGTGVYLPRILDPPIQGKPSFPRTGLADTPT
jgi:hypothetical protein